MSVQVQTADFDVSAELNMLRENNAKIGAIVSFIGLVRDLNDNAAVSEMVLEHYPAMTQKALEAIVQQAMQRWDIYDARVIHRVGRLMPADQIVLVATVSAHRADAFAACEFIMDYLKTRAPFWKKEQIRAGARWVEAKDSDEQALQRWNGDE